MSDELIATSALSPNKGETATTGVPAAVIRHLGECDRIAWYERDGRLYVVPQSEVTIND